MQSSQVPLKGHTRLTKQTLKPPQEPVPFQQTHAPHKNSASPSQNFYTACPQTLHLLHKDGSSSYFPLLIVVLVIQKAPKSNVHFRHVYNISLKFTLHARNTYKNKTYICDIIQMGSVSCKTFYIMILHTIVTLPTTMTQLTQRPTAICVFPYIKFAVSTEFTQFLSIPSHC